MKSTNELLEECARLIPGLELRNRSVTTNSIYCRTPDGYGLRIGDHRGRAKYSYKWNLDPALPAAGSWRREFNKIDGRKYWRYYTGSPADLAARVLANKRRFVNANQDED